MIKLDASFELSSRMEGLVRIVFPMARAKGHTFECRPRAQVGRAGWANEPR